MAEAMHFVLLARRQACEGQAEPVALAPLADPRAAARAP